MNFGPPSCPTTASSSWNTRPRRKPYGESRPVGSTRRRIVPRWSRGARARHRGSGRMHGLRRRRGAQVANGMVLRGGGSPWSRSGWRLRPVVMRPDSGGVPIRADPSPGRAWQGGRGGAAADPRRTGRLAGRAPRSDHVDEKPCRRGCSADVAQTPATNAATKAMAAAAQQTLCPDTWRRLGHGAHRRPCAPPAAPLWPYRR